MHSINMDRNVQSENHDVTVASKILSATLKFLSDASPQTLIASFILFAAVVYSILGRIGLLLIGAFVGAVAHDTWKELKRSNGTSSGNDPVSLRLYSELTSKLLQWADHPASLELSEATKDSQAREPSKLEEPELGPASKAALEDLEAATIRDYERSGT